MLAYWEAGWQICRRQWDLVCPIPVNWIRLREHTFRKFQELVCVCTALAECGSCCTAAAVRPKGTLWFITTCSCMSRCWCLLVEGLSAWLLLAAAHGWTGQMRAAGVPLDPRKASSCVRPMVPWVPHCQPPFWTVLADLLCARVLTSVEIFISPGRGSSHFCHFSFESPLFPGLMWLSSHNSVLGKYLHRKIEVARRQFFYPKI